MADRLTVLHLIDTGGPGGAETILKTIVQGLNPADWASIPVVPELDWLHGALSADGARPILLPASSRLRHLFELGRLLRRHRVALVHAHLLGSAVAASIAGAPLGLPVICTFHGQPDFSDGDRLLETKLRILSRRRNRIVFVSGSLRDWVLERHTLPGAAVRVIPNGIVPATETARGSERHELGASHGQLLIGALGNVRPAKDYANLLRAAALLRTRGLGARVVVMGEGRGALLDELLALRQQLGLDAGAVDFLGFHADARRLLCGLDVFVCSSSTEGFSLSTVEALWAGKPVVATRSGGPEEIVVDGHTGLLVPVGSPEALADAVERLARDRALASAMGERGAQDMRRRFSLDRMVTGYEEVYREALGLRSAPSHAAASLMEG